MTTHQPSPDEAPDARVGGRLDRSFAMTGRDYLVLKLLLALVALGSLVSLVDALWPRRTITFRSSSGDAGPAAAMTGLPANVSVHHGDELVWSITDPSLGQRVLAALPALFGALCVLAAALVLYSLASHLARDAALTRPVLNRLRVLGLVLAFGGVLWPFVRMLTAFALSVGVESSSVAVVFSLAEFAPVLAGMVVLAIAEAFHRGIGLSEDVEGLV